MESKQDFEELKETQTKKSLSLKKQTEIKNLESLIAKIVEIKNLIKEMDVYYGLWAFVLILVFALGVIIALATWNKTFIILYCVFGGAIIIFSTIVYFASVNKNYALIDSKLNLFSTDDILDYRIKKIIDTFIKRCKIHASKKKYNLIFNLINKKLAFLKSKINDIKK